MVNNIFIALGTNLGDRKKNLENAISALHKEHIFFIEKTSHIYESEPWGYLEQDPFLNMVIKGYSEFPPIELLDKIKSMEIKLGRSPTFHYGPRVIDLDILFYDKQIVNTPVLKIPHPEMKNRDFVLYPLCEIASNLIHPQTNQPVFTMLKNLPDSSIQLVNYPEIKTKLLLNLILNPPALHEYLKNNYE